MVWRNLDSRGMFCVCVIRFGLEGFDAELVGLMVVIIYKVDLIVDVDNIQIAVCECSWKKNEDYSTFSIDKIHEFWESIVTCL